MDPVNVGVVAGATFIDQIMAIVIPAVVAIAGMIASWGVYEARRFVSAKIKNAEARAAMLRITDLAEMAVAEINQKMRAAGSLPREEQKRLLKLAFDQIMAQMTPAMQQAAIETTGNLSRFVVSKIEAEVYKQKLASRSGGSVTVTGG